MKIELIHDNCLQANADYFENSRLITVGQIEESYKSFALTEGGFEVTGPVIANYIEEGKRKNFSANPCHALIVGGTGSGKTQCFFSIQAEAIARSENQPSVFFMDLKGDYYRNFSRMYREKGYKVYVLNLKEPFRSNRYNLMDPAWYSYRGSMEAKALLEHDDKTEFFFRGKEYGTNEEWRAAVQCYEYEQMELCQNYLRRLAALTVPVESKKEPSWEMGAREMFYQQAFGLLEDSNYPERGMTHEKFTLANVIRIASCTEDNCERINDWIEAREKTSSVRNLFNYYTQNAKITREGYLSTFATKMDRWKNLSTEWLTSDSDIDVEKIAENINEQKVAIFCITDETRPESYDICMAFIDHLISALKIRHDKIGPLEKDFFILADEFANMPAMPNIENRISTLRSYRVWLQLGIQSYDQLDGRYDEKTRNIILDNCDCQIFFGTNNFKTVSAFAASMGEKAAPITGYSMGNDGKLALSISVADRPLVKKSDLSGLQLGEAYVKVFRGPTVFTKLQPHFLCKDLCHDNAEPEKVIADLKLLEKSYYDIRTLELEKPEMNNPFRRRFNFDF